MSFAGCNLVSATCLIDIKDNQLASWVKYYIDPHKVSLSFMKILIQHVQRNSKCKVTC